MKRSGATLVLVIACAAALLAPGAAHGSAFPEEWWPSAPTLGEAPPPDWGPVIGLEIPARPGRPLYCPHRGNWDAKQLVGLDRFVAWLEGRAHGCQVRVLILDGEHQVVTADLRHDRVNVEVSGREVVRVIDLG
jgi:hypothetical protein